jgi:recombination associated protein RdgC
MWFKNLQVYRLPAPWAITAAQLEADLAPHAFQPCTSLDMQTQGWVSPRENGELVYSLNKQILLLLGTEKKLLPTTVINQVTKIKAAEIEEQQGFKPGRKQMKELKEDVTDELLPRAFSIWRQTWVWIDPVNGWLVVDAGSPAKADEVIKLLIKSIDKLPMEALHVVQSPVAAMTEWLWTKRRAVLPSIRIPNCVPATKARLPYVTCVTRWKRKTCVATLLQASNARAWR